MKPSPTFIDFPPDRRQQVEAIISGWLKNGIISNSLLKALQPVLEYGQIALLDNRYGERPVACYIPDAHRVIFYERFFALPKSEQGHIALHELVIHPVLEALQDSGHIAETGWDRLRQQVTQASWTPNSPYVSKLVKRFHNTEQIQLLAATEEIASTRYKNDLIELIVLEEVAEALTAWFLNGRQGQSQGSSAFLHSHLKNDAKIVPFLHTFSLVSIKS